MGKYIVIKTFKSPVVYSGGSHPRMQQNIKYVTFKRGQTLDGVLKKKENGEPDYIIHKGVIVIPIAAVKELITKEIVSNADGTSEPATKKVITESVSKVRYIDSAIVGGIIGFAITWFAEKKGWLIESPEAKIPHQNKLIGVALGAAAGAYFTYKKNVKTGIKITKDKQPK